MPFKDYSLREQEIALKPGDKIPRRLRGRLVELIQRMQKRHARCSYVELLRHYCPKVYPFYSSTIKHIFLC